MYNFKIGKESLIKVLSAAVVLCGMIQVLIPARAPLTYKQRISAQVAVERVYYAHRTWPKANKTPKPPFEAMVTREQIEAKVTDYLKKSEALDEVWHRPVTAKQLQAEMNRMARQSKNPARLKELFDALNNDPYVIAECLARPVLVNRLIHNWYGSDRTIHAHAYGKAKTASKETRTEGFSACVTGTLIRCRYELDGGNGESAGFGDSAGGFQTVKLSEDELKGRLAEMPEAGKISDIKDTRDAYYIVRTVSRGKDFIETEALCFPKKKFSEWWKGIQGSIEAKTESTADIPGQSYILPKPKNTVTEGEWLYCNLSSLPDERLYHTAVWTGTEMIIWGGYDDDYGCLNTGSKYDPATDTWTSISVTNVPERRYHHSAVWTGTEMIIWGGANTTEEGGYPLNTGGRYDPDTDTWTATSTTGAPSARYYQKAIWTGSKMIIWGGYWGVETNTGGIYDPDTDTWSPTSTIEAPHIRSGSTVVWTGSRMIVWGGAYYDENLCYSIYLNSGGIYDPGTDTWTATSTTGAPCARGGHTAVWTGSKMIIWGGGYHDGGGGDPNYQNTGGLYDPSTDTWTTTSTTNTPVARSGHHAVWTGSKMIVWGGSGYPLNDVGNTGGLYDPLADHWSPTSTTNAPDGAGVDFSGITVVWTGSEMIEWGGTLYTNIGGRYDPDTDSWTATVSYNRPEGRKNHTAIWTGSEMIVWGGRGWGLEVNDGSLYDPATDSWSPTSNGAKTPSVRAKHTAVWTGSEMIVWGGEYYDFYNPCVNTGARYNPVTDHWTTMTTNNAPDARCSHRAVWTGSKMIIWGGDLDDDYSWVNTGGIYDPSSNAWTATSTTGVPSAKRYPGAVWTGHEMIVSGYDLSGSDTGIYYPGTDTWSKASGTGSPTFSINSRAIWTGSKMIVWGGTTSNSAGLYDPGSDTWSQSTTTNAPAARQYPLLVWNGNEMIVWGGKSSAGYDNSGGRYDPTTDTWTPTSTEHAPNAHPYGTAVWADDEMIVWGGGLSSSTGGIYIPLAKPSVLGADSGCSGDIVPLSTGSYESYQWAKDGTDIIGATSQNYTATESGTYTVKVTDSLGYSSTSYGHELIFNPVPTPAVSGNSSNACPDTTVVLSTGVWSAYQWNLNGSPIDGATGDTYEAWQSGDYSVSVQDSEGCWGTSGNFNVSLVFCSSTEVSPESAFYPAELVQDAGSSTGIYVYFQKAGGATGYNIYEGNLGTWYSHGSAPGDMCSATLADMGNGEMRAEVTPSSGDHYYVVTAYAGSTEGPSGYDSSALERDSSQNTCSP